jgi:hypothetical protein
MSQIEHGTRRGYQRHRKAGEEACGPCLEANRAYFRDRRAGEKKQEKPPAAVETAPAIPDNATRFLSIAQEASARWAVAAGYVDAAGAQTIAFDDTVGLPVGDLLIGRLLELLEEHSASVLMVGRRDVVLLGRHEPKFASRVSPAKPAVVDEPPWDPADGNRARHLAAASGPMITYTARVRESRAELDRELASEEPKHRVVGATVGRGRMFDRRELGEYEAPRVEYKELPQGHPALMRESYIGGSDPKAERRAARLRR